MGCPTTFVYQFTFDKEDRKYIQVIQYFLIYGLGIWIKLDSCAEHMFNFFLLIHNIKIPIVLKGNKYDLPLNTFTTVFPQGDGNYINTDHMMDN